MKDLGILFTGDMVNAILAGRKGATRRLVKFPLCKCGCGELVQFDGYAPNGDVRASCSSTPTGDTVLRNRFVVGRKLWVRETWRTDERAHGGLDGVDGVEFRADGGFAPIRNTRAAADAWVEAHNNGKHGEKWRPSLLMPRWASRIDLVVTGVRVERLLDITDDDAQREGVQPAGDTFRLNGRNQAGPHRCSFFRLWRELHGEASLVANPWLRRVEFRVAKGLVKVVAGVEYFDRGDGEEDVQCARCGSSVAAHDDLTEDGHAVYVCLSSPEWCAANPIRGREFQKGAHLP